ncbi:MAG: hypothetical protein ACUVSK_11380 [Desulfotomaculales bacterium]
MVLLKTRCLLCGRIIEVEEFKGDLFDEEEDEGQKKKPLQICQICQAKLRHEADEAQKVPKPM